jgi:hypothetical protein
MGTLIRPRPRASIANTSGFALLPKVPTKILALWGQSKINNNTGYSSIIDLPITTASIWQCDGTVVYPASDPVQSISAVNQNAKTGNATMETYFNPTWINMGVAATRELYAQGRWSTANDHTLIINMSEGGTGLADGPWLESHRKMGIRKLAEAMSLFPNAEVHHIISQGEADNNPSISYGGNYALLGTKDRWRDIWSWFINVMPREVESFCKGRTKPAGWAYFMHPTLPMGTICVVPNCDTNTAGAAINDTASLRMIQYQKELIAATPGAYLGDVSGLTTADNVHLSAASCRTLAARISTAYPSGLAKTPDSLQLPRKPVQIMGMVYSETEGELLWTKDPYDLYAGHTAEASWIMRQGTALNSLPTTTNIASAAARSQAITINNGYNIANYFGIQGINASGNGIKSDVVKIQTNSFSFVPFTADTVLWVNPTAAPVGSKAQNLVSTTQISGAKAKPWATANNAQMTITPRSRWSGAAAAAINPWPDNANLWGLDTQLVNDGAVLTGFDWGNSAGFSVMLDCFFPWGLTSGGSDLWEILASSVADNFELQINPMTLQPWMKINGRTVQFNADFSGEVNRINSFIKPAIDGVKPFRLGWLGERCRINLSVNNTTGRVSFAMSVKTWTGTEDTNIALVNLGDGGAITETVYKVPSGTTSVSIGAQSNTQPRQPNMLLLNLIVSKNPDALGGTALG